MFALRHNPYAIGVDRERNCYNCEEFEHITKHYRNQRFVVQERRIEYRNNCNMDNLKEKENLVVLN